MRNVCLWPVYVCPCSYSNTAIAEQIFIKYYIEDPVQTLSRNPILVHQEQIWIRIQLSPVVSITF